MCECPDRDAGLSFPEVVVTVVVLAMVAAVMSTALVLTLGQHDNTGGRIHVAAAEHGLGFHLPNDLASAATATPSAGGLELAWADPDGGDVTVRYEHDAAAGRVTRTVCAATCGDAVVVARDVPDFAAVVGATRRVDVVVDGGGDVPGAGGGLSAIAFDAAVVPRTTITADSTLNAPTLANLCQAGYVTTGCPAP